MAITDADATGKHKLGISTDDKPTANVEDGTVLHCIDTGEEWVFYNGSWELDLRKINAIKMAEKLAIS